MCAIVVMITCIRHPIGSTWDELDDADKLNMRGASLPRVIHKSTPFFAVMMPVFRLLGLEQGRPSHVEQRNPPSQSGLAWNACGGAEA